MRWWVRSLPGPLGVAARWGFFRLLFAELSSFAIFYPGVYLTHTYGIRVGGGFSVNTGALLDGRGGITIGNDVLIGPYAVVSSSDHMNGPGCNTGQNANQHRDPPECRNSASAVEEERP